MIRRIAIACSILALACGDKTPTEKPNSQGLGGTSAGAEEPAEQPDVPGERPAQASGGPVVDDKPAMDLLANRYLWHMYREDLVVPLASEGVRKYVQEYRQPWGPVLAHDGRVGRVLENRSADLVIPVEAAGQRLVRIRMHGLVAGQRMTLRVNGKIVANLAPEASWTSVEQTVALTAGENSLQMLLSKTGTAAGVKSYGLFHSIELAPVASEAGEWPGLVAASKVDIGGEQRPALSGANRFAMYLEVAPSAHLLWESGAAEGTRLSVSAITADGDRHELLADTEQPAGKWVPRRISLAKLAGKLIRLELRGSGVAWSKARIALEKSAIRPRPPAVDNVILFVVDALRADRLAVYGKTRVNTPRISAEVAKRGVVFLQNQAASPSSPPSHGSLQTGMIPRVHGVTGDSGKLKPGTPMISTQVVAAGHNAAYYGNNPFGMARLEEPGRWTEFHQTNKEGKGIDCTALVSEMLDFAGRSSKANKRFFVSSLPYEPHTPYRYHEGITEKYYPGPFPAPVGKSVDGVLLGSLSAGKTTLNDAQWQQLKALYDGEVEHMDGCFGQLLDGLDALGIGGKTAVVLTADHGEGMFEHGKMGHAFSHNRELADVPFVIIADGWPDAGRKIDVVTSHLDIAPTVLDLMGIAPAKEIQGISVLPLVEREGSWTPRVVPLEYGRSYSIRARRWKLLTDYQNNQSVFDLVSDPTEQRDLAQSNGIAARYLRDLTGFFLAHRTDWRMAEWGELNNQSAAFAERMDKLSQLAQ